MDELLPEERVALVLALSALRDRAERLRVYLRAHEAQEPSVAPLAVTDDAISALRRVLHGG